MPSTRGKFPPPPPKLRTRPRVKGSVVTGYTQTGTFGFPNHRHHGLFRIETNPKVAEHSNSGYHQDVLCISCDTLIQGVDCEFLMVKATRDDLEQAMDKVVGARRQLREAYKVYGDILAGL